MVETYSGTKFIAHADCDCGQIRLTPFGDAIIVACPCLPPRTLDLGGHYNYINISWIYKNKELEDA